MSSGEPGGSTASAWLIGILLTLSLAAFLATFAAWQVTSEETGGRLLENSAIAIAGLDDATPALTEGLHEAAEANANPEIIVPNYPIIITVPRDQALIIAPGDLRDLLAEESARQMYADGMEVWAEADDEAFQDIERASTAGAVKYGLGLIQDSNHTAFGIIAAFFGVVSLVLLVLLVIVLRSAYSRLVVLGAVLIMAALPALAAAVTVRFAFKTSQPDDDPFEKAILDIGVDAMSVPIRDFLAVTVLGMAIAGMGAALMWYSSRRSEPAGTYDAGPSV